MRARRRRRRRAADGGAPFRHEQTDGDVHGAAVALHGEGLLLRVRDHRLAAAVDVAVGVGRRAVEHARVEERERVRQPAVDLGADELAAGEAGRHERAAADARVEDGVDAGGRRVRRRAAGGHRLVDQRHRAERQLLDLEAVGRVEHPLLGEDVRVAVRRDEARHAALELEDVVERARQLAAPAVAAVAHHRQVLRVALGLEALDEREPEADDLQVAGDADERERLAVGDARHRVGERAELWAHAGRRRARRVAAAAREDLAAEARQERLDDHPLDLLVGDRGQELGDRGSRDERRELCHGLRGGCCFWNAL